MAEFGSTKALNYYIVPWGAKLKTFGDTTWKSYVDNAKSYFNNISGLAFVSTAIDLANGQVFETCRMVY